MLQAIANQQTLPEMHGRLHQQLLELTGVENLTKDLRNLRPSAPPATASSPSTFPPTSSENAERMTRKLALWCDLRDQSFLLLVATTWLLPALTLIIHVQLTIIGRSTYLEEIVNSREMPRRSPPVKRRSGAAVPLTETSIEPLTPAQQQAFLSYGTFLLEDGLQNILPQIQKIVKQHVAKVDLQEKVSLAHVRYLQHPLPQHVQQSLDAFTVYFPLRICNKLSNSILIQLVWVCESPSSVLNQQHKSKAVCLELLQVLPMTSAEPGAALAASLTDA